MIHCRSRVEASSWTESVGSATLTIVVSTLTEKAQSSRTASEIERLRVTRRVRRRNQKWYKNR